jgi:hypothetical protein
VSPYAIRSSCFFQTMLGHPRITAFVRWALSLSTISSIFHVLYQRLETRAAAEEIIERLHGQMIRGWNDPGSRISVSFSTRFDRPVPRSLEARMLQVGLSSTTAVRCVLEDSHQVYLLVRVRTCLNRILACKPLYGYTCRCQA